MQQRKERTKKSKAEEESKRMLRTLSKAKMKADRSSSIQQDGETRPRPRRRSVFGATLTGEMGLEEIMSGFASPDSAGGSPLHLSQSEKKVYGSYPEISALWLRPRLIRGVFDFLGEKREMVV